MLVFLLHYFGPLLERLEVFSAGDSRVFLTARTALASLSAFLFAILLGPFAIRWLKQHARERIASDSERLNEMHKHKQSTPTMGGIFIMASLLVAVLMWGNLGNPYVLQAIAVALGYGAIGGIDDWVKLSTKKNGLTPNQKFFWQWVVAFGIIVALYFVNGSLPHGTDLVLPFPNLVIPLGVLFIPWAMFVLVGSSNAVNLTDGLDGLAAGCMVFAGIAFAALTYLAGHKVMAEYLHIPYVSGSGELSVVTGAMVGAVLGVLWVRCHPDDVSSSRKDPAMLGRRMFCVLGCLLLTHVAIAAEEPKVDLGTVTEKHVMIPMRDGVKLSAYLYFPAGDGPWPVVYEQRYAPSRDVGTRQFMARLAAGGYVVCLENFRGSQLSEGKWVGYRALGWGELKDGYDTVEWLGTQPWSTGKVGTFGSSQAGFAQNFLAVTQPPHLACQYMIDTGLSLYQEGYRIGGTTRPERFKGMDAVARVPNDNRDLMAEWFAHPTYDDYWKQEDCSLHFDKMNVPCFTIGSWYDFMCIGSVDSYIGRRNHGGPNSQQTQQLLLGPWLHGRLKEVNKVSELTYPENAKFPMEAHMLKWFDHYLKGVDNGAEKDPAVRYYVMGALGEEGAPGNEWRQSDNWPVAATNTNYYLQADAKLTLDAPAKENSETTFVADPLHPNMIPAGGFPGAADARKFEQQSEVRTFTTDVLTEPVEWTGKIQTELFVTSSAKDTDFIVRVSDVYPDGRSILIMDYIRRARYREGYEKEVFMEAGKIYKVAFDIGWFSQIFNRGHKIRVTVASTGAPFFEANPNTGEPLTIEFPKNAVVAKNSVKHEKQHASRVIAPVIRAAK